MQLECIERRCAREQRNAVCPRGREDRHGEIGQGLGRVGEGWPSGRANGVCSAVVCQGRDNRLLVLPVAAVSRHADTRDSSHPPRTGSWHVFNQPRATMISIGNKKGMVSDK